MVKKNFQLIFLYMFPKSLLRSVLDFLAHLLHAKGLCTFSMWVPKDGVLFDGHPYSLIASVATDQHFFPFNRTKEEIVTSAHDTMN